jgi:hypothetical protein
MDPCAHIDNLLAVSLLLGKIDLRRLRHAASPRDKGQARERHRLLEYPSSALRRRSDAGNFDAVHEIMAIFRMRSLTIRCRTF